MQKEPRGQRLFALGDGSEMTNDALGTARTWSLNRSVAPHWTPCANGPSPGAWRSTTKSSSSPRASAPPYAPFERPLCSDALILLPSNRPPATSLRRPTKRWLPNSTKPRAILKCKMKRYDPNALWPLFVRLSSPERFSSSGKRLRHTLADDDPARCEKGHSSNQRKSMEDP